MRKSYSKQQVRLKDIAKISGVSATTVANVIHERSGKYSVDTEKKIKRLLCDAEYAGNIGAMMLAGDKSKMIAAVIGEGSADGADLFGFLKELQFMIKEQGYHLLIKFYTDPMELKGYVKSWKVKSVLMIGVDKIDFGKPSELGVRTVWMSKIKQDDSLYELADKLLD